jgi:hypothetical protein
MSSKNSFAHPVRTEMRLRKRPVPPEIIAVVKANALN